MSDAVPRAVLVTGGGRGIGRAIALRFAEAGAQVFVNFFVNREAAEKTGDVVGDSRLIRGGLAPGDQVAASGAFKLREGGLVSVAREQVQANGRPGGPTRLGAQGPACSSGSGRACSRPRGGGCGASRFPRGAPCSRWVRRS